MNLRLNVKSLRILVKIQNFIIKECKMKDAKCTTYQENNFVNVDPRFLKSAFSLDSDRC